MTMTTVWTVIVSRNRASETNFTKPWEPSKGHEACTMYGPPDGKEAWKTAKQFLANKHDYYEPEYRVVGLLKGNFASNFYFFNEEPTRTETI